MVRVNFAETNRQDKIKQQAVLVHSVLRNYVIQGRLGLCEEDIPTLRQIVIVLFANDHVERLKKEGQHASG
jgi:CRISPR/Cas system type I-B associated protein Csh2 (Cas7 group RAMP superfamily)